MTFENLQIIEPILKALDAKGYTEATPIQEQSIPILLRGRDLLGCAQTGTGKTAAFAIPILQLLFQNKKPQARGIRKVKALIVTPTRELAIQIADNFTTYGQHTGLRNTVIFGGVKQGNQTSALRRGTDILIATPGRLLDLTQQGFINFKDLEYFVLDEADQMLDMGFIHDIKKIIAKLPVKRQSLFFSATMPKDIQELSSKILNNHQQITIKPQQATAERVEQAIYYVTKRSKPKLLVHLINTREDESVLVFSRTKHGADKIVRFLQKAEITAVAIHGNKSQGARQRALADFKSGAIKVMIATDIAARGIDVADLSLVVNFDLPNVPETYVHRIGRTGRAKASGIALSFCDTEERPLWKDIIKLIDQDITVIEDHPYVDDTPVETAKPNQRQKSAGGRQSNRGGRRPSSDEQSTKSASNTYRRRR